MSTRCICDPWAPYEDCPIHGSHADGACGDPDCDCSEPEPRE